MAKRKRYDDEFRASAVLFLQAAGYPDKKGALARTSTHLSVPGRTLSRWFNKEQNPPPDQMVSKKKLDLVKVIRNELSSIFDGMEGARDEASYRDLSWAAGVLIDKVLLLQGDPTSRIETKDVSDVHRRDILGKLASISAANGSGSVPEVPEREPGNGARQ